MMHDHERDLRAHFAELRERDAGTIPSFGDTMAAAAARRASRRPDGARLVAVGALLAAASVLIVGRWVARDPAPTVALGSWRSPTDFLMGAPVTPIGDVSAVLGSVIPDVPLSISPTRNR